MAISPIQRFGIGMARVLRLRRHCMLVYRHEYLVSIESGDERSSFEVMKFKRILDELVREGLVRRKDVLKPSMLGDAELLLVHDRAYIASLRSPLRIAELLTLRTVHPWDNPVMEYVRYVAGGTVLALRAAYARAMTVFNLGGGFHHAYPDRASGFCLVNDVAVAIAVLRRESRVRRVLIIDLDFHHGDGTAWIFRDDPSVFTFSIHHQHWVEPGSTATVDVALPDHIDDGPYLAELRRRLPAVLDSFHPEVVVYLAGSDPFIEDTLGTFRVSEAGMLKRDMYVYREVRRRGLPLAVVAGGGYGPQSWRIYYNFIRHAFLLGRRYRT